MARALGELADQDFCYLTTTGRRTGTPHTIEIWFGASDRTVYLLSGGGRASDWVRNLEITPEVRVRIADKEQPGVARVVTDGEQEQLARRLLASKYQGWREGAEMSEWARTALPVAVDLQL